MLELEIYCDCRMPELKTSYFGFPTGRVGFLPEETYFFQDTWKKLEKTGRKWFFPLYSGRKWKKLE